MRAEAAQPVVVFITYRSQPDKVDITRSALQKVIATVTATEKDCLGIELHQSAEVPERFMLLERWTSREVYEGPHMTTPHLQAFIASARQFLAGPPDISFWEGIDA